jgi:hypothetical protein
MRLLADALRAAGDRPMLDAICRRILPAEAHRLVLNGAFAEGYATFLFEE